MEKNTRLTLMEFEKYCKEHTPNEFIFDASNQINDPTNATLRFSLAFPIMRISYNPNRITLALPEKNFFGIYKNHFSFCRIKHVIFREESVGCQIFNIVCGNWLDNKKDLTYCIMLR